MLASSHNYFLTSESYSHNISKLGPTFNQEGDKFRCTEIEMRKD